MSSDLSRFGSIFHALLRCPTVCDRGHIPCICAQRSASRSSRGCSQGSKKTTSSLVGLTTCTGTATQRRRGDEGLPVLGIAVVDDGAATARVSAGEAFRVRVVAITTGPSDSCCRISPGCPSTTEGPSPYSGAGAALTLGAGFAFGLAVFAAVFGCVGAAFGLPACAAAVSAILFSSFNRFFCMAGVSGPW